jgi:integrase/recombinase XerD
MEFYEYTAGNFVRSLDQNGIVSPTEIQARHVREYLAGLASAGKSDNTIHDHARAIKTLLRFWHNENYIPAPITFTMPQVEQKRLPSLSEEELSQIIAACENPRDKALVYFMADSGLRRAEVVALNWGDIDLMTGLVIVKRGKGGKARSTVIGATVRRVLLAYRRTLKNVNENTPLFQVRGNVRITGSGLLRIFVRLSRQTGIHVTPHALRRTFVILSLRADMDVLHLQAMLGHSSLEMVRHYAQLMDEDLIREHKAHSPIDNLHRR